MGSFDRPCFVVGAILAVLLVASGCAPQQSSNGGSDVAKASPTPEREALPPATTTPSPEPLPTGRGGLLPLPADAQAATVEHHTDGDTLAVRAYDAGQVMGSTSQITVRLLEIDSPETKKPGTPIQCYGPEASAQLANLAPVGAKVYVAADQDRTDPFGRDLLYLWDAEGRSINLAMVEGGFAKAVLYAPNDRYITVLRSAEAKARKLKRGLWGACAAPPPAPARATTKLAPAPGNCDPAYPTVCIPPGPPDLDCGEISYRRFTVLAPDPHNFDADHDGVGCESG